MAVVSIWELWVSNHEEVLPVVEQVFPGKMVFLINDSLSFT